MRSKLGPEWEFLDKLGIAAGLILFVVELIKWVYLVKVSDDMDELQEDIEEMQEDIEDIEERG